MLILVTAESGALFHLHREVKFLEQQQIKRLNLSQPISTAPFQHELTAGEIEMIHAPTPKPKIRMLKGFIAMFLDFLGLLGFVCPSLACRLRSSGAVDFRPGFEATGKNTY